MGIKMNKKLSIIAIALFFIPFVHAKKTDISAYIYDAEICEHLAGEVGDQEPSEANILNMNIDKYCGRAHRQLFKLKKKYKNNKDALELIQKHTYDSVESYCN
jgi:hypothetical protein